MRESEIMEEPSLVQTNMELIPGYGAEKLASNCQEQMVLQYAPLIAHRISLIFAPAITYLHGRPDQFRHYRVN
jgi:hypothetical protein